MCNEKTGEVLPLHYTEIQVFARKVISPLGDKVTKEDIEREAKAISVLSKAGSNKNVVTILRHNWLRNRPGIYYIDMECCSTTLHDKIHDGAKILTENVEVRQYPALYYEPTVQLGEQPFLGVEPHYAESRTYKPVNSENFELTVDCCLEYSSRYCFRINLYPRSKYSASRSQTSQWYFEPLAENDCSFIFRER